MSDSKPQTMPLVIKGKYGSGASELADEPPSGESALLHDAIRAGDHCDFLSNSTDGTFLSPRNVSILIRQMSIIGILTIGMVLLIISGNIDLSVGSIAALTGGIAAVMQVWYGFSTPVSVLIGLLVGIVLGVWQGFWVAYQKVPSFIVTLGGMIMFRGIYLTITDGVTITPLAKSFTVIAQGFAPQVLGTTLAVISGVLFTVGSDPE